MSLASQALKQAKQEVLAGADRNEVFQKYRGQVTKPVKLAMTIANIPKGPIPSTGRVLNTVLFVLLLLAAALKALSIVGLFGSGVPLPALLGIIVIGLLVPVFFAIGVAKWEGQVYVLLPLICLIGVLNTWMKNPTMTAALDTIFLLVIAGLAVAVKLLVFPNIGFRGVKRDPNGEFVF